MRILYTAIFLLLFVSSALHAQMEGFAPFQGNPVLQDYSKKESFRQASAVSRLTGADPADMVNDRENELCPPLLPPGFNLVESGEQLVLQVDTFGLLVDSSYAELTVLDFQVLNFGIASIPDSTVFLEYDAFGGLSDSGIDTVLIQLEQPAAGYLDTIQVVINVVRKGREIIADGITIDPMEIVQYCLDDEVDFPAPKACSEFSECDDDYDGEGQQSFHFTSYNYPDTCLVYYANRFPGTDTVCVRICDELTVCDIYKIPITIKGDTITDLPFFEDFSTTEGPYPSGKLWLDRDVFINATFAANPPSVNMATFDGLDRSGTPYDIFAGVGDRLTSKPIDLSGRNTADSVILRFYIAPKGFGLEPESDDRLILQFRNNQREWVEIANFDGLGSVPLDSVPPFTFHAVPVSGGQFFHKSFQFRFLNTVSPGGYGDWWHLDYIHLDDQSSSAEFFRDVAFTLPPSGVLERYTSMPWNHFNGHEQDELNTEFLSGFYNHFNESQEIENSDVRIRELTTGSVFGTSFPVVSSFNIQSDTFRYGVNTLNAVPAYVSFFEDIDPAPYRLVEVEYNLTVSNQDTLLMGNDTVVTQTPFSNYFAHDDGTAELQFFVQFAQGGEEVATCFHANVDDELKAVQIMFPHFTTDDVQNQLFDLQVWDASVNMATAPDPVFVMENLKPFYADEVLDTLQGFTTFVLEDEDGNPAPVPIKAGSEFCVGWKQLTAADQGIPVGYDLTNACNCNYGRFSGTSFNPFSSAFPGSLMIRPVFGDTENTSTPVTEVSGNELDFYLYPNPASGTVRLDLPEGAPEKYVVTVFEASGNLVYSQDQVRELDLNDLPDGLYFVKVADRLTGHSVIRKLVIAK